MTIGLNPFMRVLMYSRMFFLCRLPERAVGNGVPGALRLHSYDNYGAFHQA